MFWFSIAAVSAAAALIQLGVFAVTVQILKALLAITLAIALLLGLVHVWRWYKESSTKH